ncbi:hypothetical protein WJX81_002869 [Elliptochloris bilobata]|uniref:Transcription initiation factor TFIID subunit 13 n=1 Tax=Elliptochloris bilobata TaxID=381761 RepID=A0AAW1QZA7_9CHLO
MSAPAKKLGPKGGAGKKGFAGKKGGVGTKKGKGAAAQVTETNLKHRGLFSKDLKFIMYGYGDTATPYKETVDLVEDIVVEYVSALAHKAMAGAAGKGGRMLPEDLLYLLRKDPHKFARAQELLRMNEEIQAAKKVYDDDEKLLPEDF